MQWVLSDALFKFTASLLLILDDTDVSQFVDWLDVTSGW